MYRPNHFNNIVQENNVDRNKNSYAAFMDLEKAYVRFDRQVIRKVAYWGCKEWMGSYRRQCLVFVMVKVCLLSIYWVLKDSWVSFLFKYWVEVWLCHVTIFYMDESTKKQRPCGTEVMREVKHGAVGVETTLRRECTQWKLPALVLAEDAVLTDDRRNGNKEYKYLGSSVVNKI